MREFKALAWSTENDRMFPNHVAFANQDLDDLSLSEALAQIR